MPVYVCLAGGGHEEPWRHGIQVYTSPFLVDPSDEQYEISNQRDTDEGFALAVPTSGGGRDLVVGALEQSSPGVDIATDATGLRQRRGGEPQRSIPFRQHFPHPSAPPPIRRIRHAEVVLIDDVCIAHGRYWLRLRWPGHFQRVKDEDDGKAAQRRLMNAAFAGYVAMGRVRDAPLPKILQRGLYFLTRGAGAL
jgi:hypothetical protein